MKCAACETQEVQVSRLIRIRYGDIPLEKHIPRGGWDELGLERGELSAVRWSVCRQKPAPRCR